MAARQADPSPRAHTFDGFADEVIDSALKHARTATARRGESLTRQGEPARQFFVIRDGYAKLVSTSGDGRDLLVAVAGPRDAFGQAATADDQRSDMVTCTALTPLTAAVWDLDKALAIAREFPEVHKTIAAQLVANLDLILSRLHRVTEGRVGQRLARALLELGERHGLKDCLGILIVPPLTRQDIAALVGTTVFTASRTLSDWEARGLVEAARARVRLRNIAGLRQVASEP